MTSREAKEYFKETVRIEQLIGQYVQLRRTGAGFTGLCPFHNEKTPSFHVSPARAAFKCFGCGIGGDIYTFIQEYHKLTFPEAIRWFGKQYNIEIEDRVMTDQEKEMFKKRETVFLLNEFAAHYYHAQLTNDIINQYGELLAINNRIAEHYNIGFCDKNQKDAFTIAAQKALFSEEALLSSGLSQRGEDGKLHDTINTTAWVIPIEGKPKKYTSFIVNDINGSQHTIKSMVYQPDKTLFGLETNKKDIRIKDRCVLTTSIADMFALYQANITYAVANLNNTLTTFQIKAITDSTRYVTICSPSNTDNYKLIYNTLLQLLEGGVQIKLVNIPEESLLQYANGHNADEVVELIEKQATSFIQYICGHHAIIGTADDNIIICEVCQLLKKMPAMEQQLYARELAQTLCINESIVIQQISK